jgi:protein-tyrosine-phosphatase/predicted ATP-grasp superfamily ATP-dependent carboligase
MATAKGQNWGRFSPKTSGPSTVQGRKALVLGEDTRSFLAVLRSLGRAGMEVHAAPMDFTSPALRSRYLAASHYLPLWSGDGAAWRDAMEALLRRETFDIVIPCTEIGLLPLAAERARFGALARLAIPDDAAIAALFDKAATRELARAHGVAVAEGATLGTGDDADALIARFGLPLMLKPRRSYTLHGLEARGKVETMREPEALAQALARIAPDDYLVERFFPGAGVGVSVLAHHGRVLLAFAHRRIRETSAGGSYYRVSIPADPAMLAGCEAMLGALNYTGVAMFEFRQNLASGDRVLLEVNARPWGSMPLPVALGIDFPAAWARLLLDGVEPPRTGYRQGVHGRNLLPDMADLAQQLPKAGAAAPKLLLARLWEFSRVLTGREKHDTLVADDMRPGLVEIGTRFRSLPGSLFGRLPKGGTVGGMVAARWRQRLALRRLRRALHSPQGKRPRLEFVCAGNICRSPYAEAAFARIVSSLAVRVVAGSAGTLPREGRPTPEHGLAEAAARGFDLAPHRSAHFELARAEAADLVIAFDERNLAALAARYPHLRRHCVLLGDFDRSGPIGDPDGGDRFVFAACYARIDRAVAALAGALSRS